MIKRLAQQAVQAALKRQAAVALLGPRQVGKTTLALQIADQVPSVYLDLEDDTERAKLADPRAFLEARQDRLVVLDEIHRMPEIFQTMRGLIDRGRREGSRTGRFLVLGSASLDLLRQSGESLAGRIAYVELFPLDVLELPESDKEQLWLRGGFPASALASNDAESLALRRDFVRSYLEREVPMFGGRIPAETLRRLWTMLAHGQGTLLNASNLARNLAVSYQTVTRYIDLLVDLLLVRRLQPYHINLGKRLVKSPKIYVRDSGIAHALLGIQTRDDLYGHPVMGLSWEGFVIENLLAAAGDAVQPYFYRTAVGAEIDLLLEMPGGKLWAIEIKRGPGGKPERGFHNAREDLKPVQSFVVYAGPDRYPVGDGIEAIGLRELAAILADLRAKGG